MVYDEGLILAISDGVCQYYSKYFRTAYFVPRTLLNSFL